MRLSAPAIGRDPLVGQPEPGRRFAGLIEHIDGDAAARIPVTANPQPGRVQQFFDPLANVDRARLVKAAMVAIGAEKQFQGLALDRQQSGT